MHTTRNTAADGKTSEIAAILRAAKRKRREDRPAAGRTRLHHQAARACKREGEKKMSENESRELASSEGKKYIVKSTDR